MWGEIERQLICQEGKTVTLLSLQKYILEWYHAYLFRPGEDQTEDMIHQHVYWPNISDYVRNIVIRCDMRQHSKRVNGKSGLSASEGFWVHTAEQTTCGSYCTIRCIEKEHDSM